MAEIYAVENRHGMLLRPFESIEDYVETISQATYLILREDGEIIPSSRPFSEHLVTHGPDFDAFLFHEHYIWNSARLRAAYGTIEIRPACQQPWEEHMAHQALSLGVLEAREEIETYVQESLGSGYWTVMQRYHRQVIAHGLAAPQPAPGFLAKIVSLAKSGLEAREYGEEQQLQPIHRRLEQGRNPAQSVRSVFQIDGLNGLLSYTAIHPTTSPDI
jgi:gamma-glutamylcysteine synthetase